jgi:hypothetical protein
MTRVSQEIAPGISFVDHNANDVLLWMTEEGERGPFDSTAKLWRACVEQLEGAGLIEHVENGFGAIRVTPSGHLRATALREHASGSLVEEGES